MKSMVRRVLILLKDHEYWVIKMNLLKAKFEYLFCKHFDNQNRTLVDMEHIFSWCDYIYPGCGIQPVKILCQSPFHQLRSNAGLQLPATAHFVVTGNGSSNQAAATHPREWFEISAFDR